MSCLCALCGCAEFIAVCGTLKHDMLAIMRDDHGMPQEAIDWVDQVRTLSSKRRRTRHVYMTYSLTLAITLRVLFN